MGSFSMPDRYIQYFENLWAQVMPPMGGKGGGGIAQCGRSLTSMIALFIVQSAITPQPTY